MEAHFKGLFLTKYPAHGVIFSDEVISKIVIEQPRVPVRVNFAGTPIGHSEFFTKTKHGLEVAFTLNSGMQDNAFLYIVPDGTYDLADVTVDEDGIRTIHKLKLTELSLTLRPADPTLAPFTPRKVEETHDEKSEPS